MSKLNTQFQVNGQRSLDSILSLSAMRSSAALILLLSHSALCFDAPARVHARPSPLRRTDVQANDKSPNSDPVLRPELMLAALLTGTATGVAVAGFKTGAVSLAAALYSGPLALPATPGTLGAFVVVPALGGLLIGALRVLADADPDMGPTPLRTSIGADLAQHAAEVERSEDLSALRSLARGTATTIALGSGNSVGATGPAVEIGGAVSRLVAQATSSLAPAPIRIDDQASGVLRWRRQLLASGSAAGVAAIFAAPLTGVFFAMEVVPAATRRSVVQGDGIEERRDAAELDTRSRTTLPAIVLSATVAAAVVRVMLGADASGMTAFPTDEAFVGDGSLEGLVGCIPLYAVLGALSGCTATCFKQGTNAVGAAFGAGGVVGGLPGPLKPALGGLACGLVGAACPQVLWRGFVGQSMLDAVGAGASATQAEGADVAASAVALLVAKLVATCVCIGSGVVGGIFAPCLFLGAATGVAFHGALVALLPSLPLDSTSVFAMIGAAATLSSVFSAPLTATMLAIELTRGPDLALPLLAAAGTGPLVAGWLEAQLTAAAATPPSEATERGGKEA